MWDVGYVIRSTCGAENDQGFSLLRPGLGVTQRVGYAELKEPLGSAGQGSTLFLSQFVIKRK
jgi:hypothetical protein